MPRKQNPPGTDSHRPEHQPWQHSTGPKSEEGKAISSQNARTHGCTSTQLLLPHEDPAEWEALQTAWLRDYSPMYAANVEGTRNVIEAAAEAGCSRIVYTSTVGCIGLPKAVNGTVTPTDEDTPVAEAQMSNHYKISKWRAEKVALQLAKKGLPVVIVNPTAPIGPRDVKPTPTGQIIVDFLNRKMPAYLDTGLNWVHVRDVVVGHILAAERGRIGERYILGHAEGNWSMKQALDVLSEITGLSAPKFRVPHLVALIAAHVDETRSRITGRVPKAPVGGVRMAKYKMFFSPAKSIRELGLPQTNPKQALAEAVEWFRAHGYVKK